MVIRDVIMQLLQYPLDAPLFIQQNGQLLSATTSRFTVNGPITIDGKDMLFNEPQTGFAVISEIEYNSVVKSVNEQTVEANNEMKEVVE